MSDQAVKAQTEATGAVQEEASAVAAAAAAEAAASEAASAPSESPLTQEEALFEEIDGDDLDIDGLLADTAEAMASDVEYTLSSVIPEHTAVARLVSIKPQAVKLASNGAVKVRCWIITWNLEYNIEEAKHTSRSFTQRIYMLSKQGLELAMGKEQWTQFLAGLVVAAENLGQSELDKKALSAAKREAVTLIRSGADGYTVRELITDGIDTPMVLDVTVRPAKGEYEADNGVRMYALRPADATLIAEMAETAEA